MPDPEPDPRPDPEPPAGAPGGTGGRGDPHRSRLRALKVLFQADLRGEDPRVWLERVDEDPAARALLEDADTDDQAVAADELDAFSRRLVDGVGEHLGDIDAVLEEHSHHWPVHRMAALDRNVLRLGVYELRHEDTPPAVVIDEAVELAKALSTDDSRRFVNGVLEAVRAAEAGGSGGAGGGSGGV